MKPLNNPKTHKPISRKLYLTLVRARARANIELWNAKGWHDLDNLVTIWGEQVLWAEDELDKIDKNDPPRNT